MGGGSGGAKAGKTGGAGIAGTDEEAAKKGRKLAEEWFSKMGVEKIGDAERKKPLKMMKITLVELGKLKPHEALVQKELDDFIENATSSGIFWKPLLVAYPSYVILDGHHRWAGLVKLGAKKIPCILLDYLNDREITLGTWYPVLVGGVSKALEVLSKDREIKIEYAGTKEGALARIESGRASFTLINDSMKKFPVVSGDQKKIMGALEKTEGVRLEFVGTREAAFEEAGKKDRTAMIRRAVTKQDVVDMTLSGNVFAPKTTRHILPYRYQEIYVKLEDLM